MLRSLSLFVVLLLAAGCTSGAQEEAPAGPDASPAPHLPPDTAHATDGGPETEGGATVYVPVYSHIYHQDGSRQIDLAATLTIRNTDPAQPVVVTAVRYYDSAGRPVRDYLQAPLRLGPLASQAFVVEERDQAGGIGANFLVDWRGDLRSDPIVEAVMISTASTQGISFVSRGEVVRRHAPSEDPLDR